jgi:hypothetical protein
MSQTRRDDVNTLTVREKFAIGALQGLLANPGELTEKDLDGASYHQYLSENAVIYADELIKALNKNNTEVVVTDENINNPPTTPAHEKLGYDTK